MEPRRIKHEGRAKLFENPLLDMLTRTSPYIIWGIYLPISIYLLYYSRVDLHFGVGKMVLLFFIGMFAWTLAEYLLHRFLFHLPANSRWAERFTYLVHGVHHEYPKDKERLFMPPVPSLIIASLLFAFFYLFLRKATFSFFPGFVIGYLLYATTHYLIHAIPHPPKPFRALWQHHLLHHYKYPDKAFGVSNRFWDRVFGTMPPDPRQEKKQSV